MDAQLPEELKPSFDRLLDLKRNGPEKMKLKHIGDIDDFLNQSIQIFQEYLSQLPMEEPKSWDRMNRFFIEETKNTLHL